MATRASTYGRESIMASDRTYRKVELQSPADLTYLVGKVSRAARDKIDKHFPPEAAVKGEDRMKAQVELQVDEYIRATFNLAKTNLSINGMDTRELEAELAKAQPDEAEFEPFDAQLAYRIQDLSREIEEQQLQLAELRRSAPAQTAAKYRATIEAQHNEDTKRLESQQQTCVSKAAETKLNIVEMARLEEVQQTWQETSQKLQELHVDLEETLGKAEQARRAQRYVSGT